MYEQEKQEMIETALEMKRNNLIALAGGNVSLRMPNGDIIITPSGMSYEIMTPDDMIVFDKDKNIIEGTRKQSVDTPALFYILIICRKSMQSCILISHMQQQSDLSQTNCRHA